MTRTDAFRNYMMSGHGRAAVLLKGHEDEYRDIVLYGCLNDISFDIQCEGSRGYYMYNLVSLYTDPDYFITKAIEKYLDDAINGDRNIVCHLDDFLHGFAAEGNKAAANAREEKYRHLHSIIMARRYGAEAQRNIESYEYLAIASLDKTEPEKAIGICRDIGEYYLRRKKTSDEELGDRFGWFLSDLNDEFGTEKVNFLLEENAVSSAELRRFIRIRNTHEAYRENLKKVKIEQAKTENGSDITADHIIGKVNRSEMLLPRDKLRFSKAAEAERIRLAEAAVKEKVPAKKAELLRVFDNRDLTFPLEPQIIIDLTKSENEILRRAAYDVMQYIRSDKVYDYAYVCLNKTKPSDESYEYAVSAALTNYRDEDKDILLEKLYDIPVNDGNLSVRHSIVMTILNFSDIPDEFLSYVYLRSPCSECRSTALEKLSKRGHLPANILEECAFDCNPDIRMLAQDE